MKLASARVFSASDCPEGLARRAKVHGVSPAWLAAKAHLDREGWFCLGRKAQKVLGYTWQKVTTTEPFYHGAWIKEAPHGNAVLFIVDHTDLKDSPVKGSSC